MPPELEYNFRFGFQNSRVLIQEKLPSIDELICGYPGSGTDAPAVLVCDGNTECLAKEIAAKGKKGGVIPIVTLKAGEQAKTWESAEAVLKAAAGSGLGRDGAFIGVGGGTISDLAGFAASIYMRGARLCIVSTTLLGMVDAGIGGKTGIDLMNIKNLAGTFYPADLVIMPLEALDTLPEREWKSGMAELIKTGILSSGHLFGRIKDLNIQGNAGRDSAEYRRLLEECISLALAFKGRVAESDFGETGSERALLNLGHTFAHALESTAGLGKLSHGEAVAWGIARSCELGTALGITPAERAGEITGLLKASGYEISSPHPLASNPDSIEAMYNFMMSDKKRKAGIMRLIVPGQEGAQIVSFASDKAIKKKDTPAVGLLKGDSLLRKILKGECQP